MVRSELRRDPKADLSKWCLLHGASYPADLGYREELQGYVANNKLHYYGTVSRPKDTGWTGDTGYSIEKAAKGWMSTFTSGEGLVCRFKGPGKIWIQTRNPQAFGAWVRKFVPSGE